MAETYVYTAPAFHPVPVSSLLPAAPDAAGPAAAFMITPADPAPTSSTTPVMLGIGQSFIPHRSGRLLITVSGQLSNTTNNQGVTAAICCGSGGAPAAGDAQAGLVLGTPITAYRATTGAPSVPFCQTVLWQGLAADTAYWLDLALSVSPGGQGSVTALTLTAVEIT